MIPMKISQNQKFSDVFRRIKMEYGEKSPIHSFMHLIQFMIQAFSIPPETI